MGSPRPKEDAPAAGTPRKHKPYLKLVPDSQAQERARAQMENRKRILAFMEQRKGPLYPCRIEGYFIDDFD